MRIFLNALGANTASGLTYLSNVLPQLARRKEVCTFACVAPEVRTQFSGLDRISWLELPQFRGTAHRFWFEQTQLSRLIRQVRGEMLISTGNFALRNAPVPQILLSGNSLYNSQDFYRDLLSRREYRLWLDTRVKAILACRSVSWADCTIAPTRTFANQLHRWTGRPAMAVPHGFDANIFFSDESPLAAPIQEKLNSAKDALKLLYVSHYNYFRNFETLFRALPMIGKALSGRPLKLFLTCRLEDGKNPGLYKTESARRLVKEAGLEQYLVELGPVPYRQLHHLYRACDVYVSPSYAESFAHPLVEAQACGLPVIASDLPVHREVCGDAALYFSRFSPEALAEAVTQMVNSRAGRPAPAITPFSWEEHVDQLIAIAESLLHQPAAA